MPWTALGYIIAIIAGVSVVVWLVNRPLRKDINRAVRDLELAHSRQFDLAIEAERSLRMTEQEALLHEILALAEEVRSVIRALQAVDPDGMLDRPLQRLDLMEADLQARVTSS
jgi:hypothetical protein